MPISNFIPNSFGKLSTDRYDFEKHVDGSGFRQNATTIDLLPTLTIGSVTATTIQEALALLQDGYGDGYTGGNIVNVNNEILTTITLLTSMYFITFTNNLPTTCNLPIGILGQTYKFKNKGSGNVIITPNGSQTLFGTTRISTFILGSGNSIEIIFDGTDWNIL